ncbi:energy transducer TonB [Flavobacterium sp. DGU11]|uniref:Energy transducer TonB n=1 Tax=Flavobacterium arundinis TaxID=3139143 RepID=A0ABU9HYY3_9FLAO
MKKLIFFFFIAFIVNITVVNAQEKPIDGASKNPPEGYIQPQYRDGLEAFYKYVEKGIKRRHMPSKSGKIYAYFIVEKDGSISNVKILRGIEEKIDARIVKLISESIKWTPGYINGLPTRASYNLPITITIGE